MRLLITKIFIYIIGFTLIFPLKIVRSIFFTQDNPCLELPCPQPRPDEVDELPA